jgi:hypothetical protein
LSRIFPSFERPVAPPRYLNVRPERRGLGLTVAGVFAAGLACAIALTPKGQDQPASAAVETAAAPVSTARVADEPQQKVAAAEPAKTPAPEKTVARAAKLAVTCARSATARRDCVEAKEAKAAVLASAMAAPEAAPAQPATPPAATETVAAAEAADAETVAAPPAPKTPKKVKKPRFADEGPVERLVRVYDQIMPDGRRVPVYRRANGGYESGAIVDGEYRRAAAIAEHPRYFGLQ